MKFFNDFLGRKSPCFPPDFLGDTNKKCVETLTFSTIENVCCFFFNFAGLFYCVFSKSVWKTKLTVGLHQNWRVRDNNSKVKVWASTRRHVSRRLYNNSFSKEQKLVSQPSPGKDHKAHSWHKELLHMAGAQRAALHLSRRSRVFPWRIKFSRPRPTLLTSAFSWGPSKVMDDSLDLLLLHNQRSTKILRVHTALKALANESARANPLSQSTAAMIAELGWNTIVQEGF